ncbi:MAG: 4-(cytidine 5'-diphospho)-2-C-methyl-D-erythritol kinase [Candidatus Omnitrophota bacterium]|nr:4-(cytidine 5'-diphospho)-2-C-methyl-D-erythritol kinase [Candidatus Omnitrophota bacterium]
MMVLQSPAKLNLYLRIVGKRADGYHELVTLFERIDLCDEIRLKPLKDGSIRIRCSHPDVPCNSQNIAYQAAQLLKKGLNVPSGVEITIRKRIPVAAGLGGGSSNAATVLKGLNQLWKLKLNVPQLVDYARQIGSDVPFFLYDTSYALGTCRGDKITKVSLRAKLWHVLVVPRVKMLTKMVYGEVKAPLTEVKLSLTKKNDNVNILIHHLRNNDIKAVGATLCNDLEPAIFRLNPRLKDLKEKLKLFDIQGVAISGSGPSIFALTKTSSEALRIKKLLTQHFKQVFVVQTY